MFLDNLPDKAMRDNVLSIAKEAMINADQFCVGRITAVKEQLEMNDIYLKPFQIESIVFELKDKLYI
jgi:hypothetical protein